MACVIIVILPIKKKFGILKNYLTNQDVLDIMIKHKIELEYQTDSHFSYCNTNYLFLALIIEKITGLSYSDSLQKYICKPLGMKNTFCF
ncbi:MAG: beta-lactamase family protein [Leptolyngbyaceae cyanobacterium CSU_1_4]|nr:beta-lactamase family protein [Leptolyngbyaceae cyanobacterium CSU_1_4]